MGILKLLHILRSSKPSIGHVLRPRDVAASMNWSPAKAVFLHANGSLSREIFGAAERGDMRCVARLLNAVDSFPEPYRNATFAARDWTYSALLPFFVSNANKLVIERVGAVVNVKVSQNSVMLC